MIRVALREAPPQPLDASVEMLSQRDAEIVFVQVGKVKVKTEGKDEVKMTGTFFGLNVYTFRSFLNGMVVMFGTKGLFGLSVYQFEALPPDTFSPPSSNPNSLTSFVQFGEVSDYSTCPFCRVLSQTSLFLFFVGSLTRRTACVDT